MPFPSSPTNGQQATVNGITYSYASATGSWRRTTLSNVTLDTVTAVTVNAATIGNSGASLTGTLQTAAQTNITSVGTLTGLTLSGTLTGTTINAATIGNSGASLTGTLQTAAQTNITSLGTLTGLTLSGTLTGTTINASTIGNSGASIVGNLTGSATTATTAQYVTGLTSSNVTTALGYTPVTWTTVANTAPASPNPGDFWYDSYTEIKYQYINDGAGNLWVDQSAPTSFSNITVENILNGGSPGTGNIGASGSGFNTVFAKATSAQYADLAEIYESDVQYEPGTVVIFGGAKEITVTTKTHDTRVAGVISTNPAYLMNSNASGLPVAFTGRVPCNVIGPVKKGDLLVASANKGYAQVMIDTLYKPGCILGKALSEVVDNQATTIEIVVGRF